MSKQVTINQSFYGKLEKLEEMAEEVIQDKLMDIAETAVNLSERTVDTGAYITSFSFVPAGSSAGRMRTSNNKPTGQSPQAMGDEALGGLISDIKSIDLKATPRVTLRNRSPHAREVEDGKEVPNSRWRKSGYGIFRSIRSIHG